MWCPKCQTEKEVTQTETNSSPVCEDCQSVLTASPMPQDRKNSTDSSETTHAHELLQRWSNQRMLSPESEIPTAKNLSALQEDKLPEITDSKRTPKTKPSRRHSQPDPARKTVKLSEHLQARQEQAISSVPNSAPKQERETVAISRRPEAVPPTKQPQETASPQPRKAVAGVRPVARPTSTSQSSNRSTRPRVAVRNSAPHRKPEYDVQVAIREQIMKQKSMLSAIGYFFSYGGVLLLTGGAGLSLYSYFGQSIENIPTEYLITTIGQLFLFAGLVMLVSVVMDQIGKKILFRVSQLDDRLASIEEYLARLETEEHQERTAPQPQRAVPLRKAG